MRWIIAGLLVWVAPMVALAQAPTPGKDFAEFLKKPEPDYSWSLKDKTATDAGTIYTLDLTSQKWHDVVWKHGLQIIVPKSAAAKSTMVLWNQGGSPSASTALLAMQIAERMQAPVAFLYGVPNQPIPSIGGTKKEDALIAETFVRFLESGDPTWPLLFPMAKSLFKSMDAIQEFAKKEMQHEVTHFVVTGASKRGWTSWLVGAAGDKRVKGIAPLVIDTLHFKVQMPHQLEMFGGKYSLMIHDYQDRKLLPIPEGANAEKLWQLVDPWAYRESLTLPKMIINGTNDPYWTQDALNLYWDDLKGEKHVAYVPNAGHDLRPMTKPNQLDTKKDTFPMRSINTLTAFARHLAEDKPMPQPQWTLGKNSILVKFPEPCNAYRVWTCESKSKDFRQSLWSAAADQPGKTAKEATINVPQKPDVNQAALIEMDYAIGDLNFTLTTQILIVPPAK
ncbi:MAG: PhoPQ-activated pathogenicity-related family protein [Gemmataceae bacterium]